MVEVARKYQMLMSSFLFLFFLLFACQQSKKEVPAIENKIQIEKFSRPDFSVNQLKLRKENTFKEFYSQNLKLQDKLRYSPVLAFVDKNENKYFLAYQYEGDTKNSFSCFEIGYIKDDLELKKEIAPTKYEDFETESGLKLGISFDEIINLKGKDYKVEKKSNGDIVRYVIDDPDNPKIKEYEMPPYFMEFYVKDNKVYKIIFGFEYP